MKSERSRIDLKPEKVKMAATMEAVHPSTIQKLLELKSVPRIALTNVDAMYTGIDTVWCIIIRDSL